jgi:uncharacterized membrane protein
MEHDMGHAEGEHRKRLIAPGLLLGAGLGGFLDGIVLHQILQWHHLLSATEPYAGETVAALKGNTTADGFFHAATWSLSLVGLLLLLRATDRPRDWTWRSLIGLMLVGWGLFNLVEGVIDHHVLQIHHVRSGENEMLYDLGFLALGALLVVAGIATYRNDARLTAE